MLVFIEDNGGWISPPKITELIDRLKIHNFPELYRNEQTLINAMFVSFCSADEIKELGAELEKVPEHLLTSCSSWEDGVEV